MQRSNPLKLNPLQLRTLAILQRLAALEAMVTAGGTNGFPDRPVTLHTLPHPHGDHFHVGQAVVAAQAATGLHNPSVWAALARKGLIEGAHPGPLTVTEAGRAYKIGELGLFHEHSHHEH